MERAGVGECDGSGIQFASPCFFVKRPQSTKLRLCVAFNDINAVTTDEIFPILIFHNYKVLPFGPKNGPAHFQRQMRLALKEGLGTFILVYLDDIIIFSR